MYILIIYLWQWDVEYRETLCLSTNDKLIVYRFPIKEVSDFATDLIGFARTAEEVECVLKQTAGFGRSSTFAYPRLLLALDYKQKTFVAHPNVQQVWSKLNKLYYGILIEKILLCN